MARIFTHNEHVSLSMAHTSLFATSWLTKALSLVQLNLVWPIIKFELTDNFKHTPVAAEPTLVPTEYKICTNGGFKKFKFNINNYFKTYKTENGE